MNKYIYDILQILFNEKFINQRYISEKSGYSLGIINKGLKRLLNDGYIDENGLLKEKVRVEFKNKAPKSAIILAAGFGMRMVPINTEIPKGLLEVDGEPLIERLIKQLHEVGIENIKVIVGFMKERYEFLIDKYNVKLIVNNKYAFTNNLQSLDLVCDSLANSYIMPCDIWCAKNPFHRHELYSWYMVSDLIDEASSVRVNRKEELVSVKHDQAGNQMIGIAYLLKEEADKVKENIKKMVRDKRYNDKFWEEALFERNKMLVYAKVVHSREVIEINTYEQLRDLDTNSDQLNSNAIDIICNALKVNLNEIYNITVLKKGMTNRSFLFSCKGDKYIMRIPGEGTDQLIDRSEEASVYDRINGKGICDEIMYINPANGYKITKYIEGARVCDPLNVDDVKDCMKKLKQFHDMEFKVDHEFHIFEKINFYESLWKDNPSVYQDYEITKKNVFSLRNYIKKHSFKKCLAHIDAVPDNFLFYQKDGKEELRLIDWEYAAMQDPHVDIAMFIIYALYDRKQADELIDIYFEGQCNKETRIKIYCYIAACGLLWSNWCEYKLQLGVEFGEYSLRQYRYAKDYYRIVKDELKESDEDVK